MTITRADLDQPWATDPLRRIAIACLAEVGILTRRPTTTGIIAVPHGTCPTVVGYRAFIVACLGAKRPTRDPESFIARQNELNPHPQSQATPTAAEWNAMWKFYDQNVRY